MQAYPLPSGYRGFERVPNEAVNGLTVPALGLLVRLLCYRDRYSSLDDVAADPRSGLSRTAARRYGAELRAAGYLRKVVERGSDGRLRSRVEVSALPIWLTRPGRTEGEGSVVDPTSVDADIAAGHIEDGGSVVGPTISDAASAQVAARTREASSVRPGEMPVSAGRSEGEGVAVGPTSVAVTSTQVSGSDNAPLHTHTDPDTNHPPSPPSRSSVDRLASRGREEREEGEISSEEREYQAAAEALAAGLPQSPASVRPPSRQERQRLVDGIRRALAAGWTAAALRSALVADTGTARRLVSVYLSRLDPEHEAYLGDPPSEPSIPEWCGQCDPHGAEDPHQRWIELPDGRVARCPRCWPRPVAVA